MDEKPRETTVEFLASLAGVLVTGLFIITFILQAFEIPSSSMEDTLLIGDHVFVNREQFAPPTRWMGPLMPYRDIHRNDIVVFLSPEEQGLFVVKRIMGVPGDRIHLRDGVSLPQWRKTRRAVRPAQIGGLQSLSRQFPRRPAVGNVRRKKRKMDAGTAFACRGRRHRRASRTATLPWATTAT